MSLPHTQELKALRDQLVENRRSLVANVLADPRDLNELGAEFVGLQHFIDAVERALAHEAALSRPESNVPPIAKTRRQ